MDTSPSQFVTFDENIGLEEGWGEISDPKEKKRVQNRIAQRTYRQRMKSRLEKLEARVNYHERANMKNGENENDIINVNVQRNDAIPTGQNRLPETETNTITSKYPRKDQQVLETDFNDFQFESGDKELYIQPTQLLEKPASQPLSPISEYASQTPKRPGKPLGDYMRIPKYMAGKYYSPPTASIDTAHSAQRDSRRPALRSMGRVEQPSCVQPFPMESGGAMDFENPGDLWTSDILSQQPRPSTAVSGGMPNPLPQVTQVTQPAQVTMPSNGDQRLSVPLMDAGSSMPYSQVPLPRHRSLEERFETVLDCAHSTGFENFDALVITYYKDDFAEPSLLTNEQRLSRNRGLPKVVSEVFQATNQWSDWERRGFHEEIMKITEAMLLSECNHAKEAFKMGMGPIVEAQDFDNKPTLEQALGRMKTMIQNDLPNLWALMSTLSADDGDTIRQRNRSQIVIAVILLLRSAGRIPNDKLLKLISTCLQG